MLFRSAARVNASWGQPFEMVKPGASYKQYPCCYSTHAAIEAALTLTRKHGAFDAATIAKVETGTPALGLSYTKRPQPQSDLDAKFSVQYCVTRALTESKVVLEYFENEAFKQRVPQCLLPRVHSQLYTGQMFDPVDLFDAELRLTLTDGHVFQAKVDRPLGCTSDIPIPFDQPKAKYEDCAGRVLTRDVVARSLPVIDCAKKECSVSDLSEVIESGVLHESGFSF